MKYLPFALTVALAGCVAPPTQQELTRADYGPKPESYQVAIKSYMDRVLKDPESARYEFLHSPVKGFSGNPRVFGWITCVDVNAKNSYGGYTGKQRHFFLLKRGSVLSTMSGDGNGGILDEIVAQACSGIFSEPDEDQAIPNKVNA